MLYAAASISDSASLSPAIRQAYTEQLKAIRTGFRQLYPEIDFQIALYPESDFITELLRRADSDKESSIEYSLRYWIDNPMNHIGIISDVNQAIWNAFQQAGISIAYPKQVDYIRELPELRLSAAQPARDTDSDAASAPNQRSDELI